MQNLKHDIAVLQLERPAQLSNKVATVCLPEQVADLNTRCYITGLAKYVGDKLSWAHPSALARELN